MEKLNMLRNSMRRRIPRVHRLLPEKRLVLKQQLSRPVLAILGLVMVALLAGSLEAGDSPPLNRYLEAATEKQDAQQCSVSVRVVELDTGRVLMEKNAHLPLVPASTLKLVTSAAALSVLKPDFTFTTEVLADDIRPFSVGNIFLRGTGDPYLVSEELFALTRALRDRGLREIRGNIVVDESYFNPSQPLDENEKLGHRAYHAPYSALSLNFNAVKLLVIPGARVGQAAQITLDPLSEYATVQGHVNTVKGDQPPQLTIKKETMPGDREIISVDGQIGEAAAVKGRYVNVASPGLYTGEVFKEFLLREGVKTLGRVMSGTTPSSAEPYYEFSSRPLGIIVYGLNKFSNNFMAEQLCMALGAKVYGAPGTRENGLSVIRKYLLSCGVPEAEFTLSEASGLSRNNRLSAAALVQVLLTASKDFSYGQEFMASLGVAGVDGTLKEKFTDKDTRRRLRAKTGTLRGINALAGYGISPNGKRFAFAVIVNSRQKGVGIIDHADRIARHILEIPMGRKQ
jgi:serine-type D-Ala-D-Ala carboxypeptidase/endopeptidase (penicillin-binding protein 4)